MSNHAIFLNLTIFYFSLTWFYTKIKPVKMKNFLAAIKFSLIKYWREKIARKFQLSHLRNTMENKVFVASLGRVRVRNTMKVCPGSVFPFASVLFWSLCVSVCVRSLSIGARVARR